MKDGLIAAGLRFFRATGLDRIVSVVTRGNGAILMFHRIRASDGSAYAPNLALEITPDFLEATLQILDSLGYEIAPIGEVPERLAQGGTRFAVLTFDDGYRDNLEIAAPILQRRNAPYTIYVTTGFAERSARLWWFELEAAIGALDRVEMRIGGDTFSAPSATVDEKRAAYAGAFAFLRTRAEAAMLDQISALMETAGVATNFSDLCMTWDEIRTAAQDPLCTIGVHTLTHARLALHGEAFVRRELQESREIISAQIGRPADHLAYPFGDPRSVGKREFEIAQECGFATAVTTRPGVLFAGHSDHLMALPRVAVHGEFQDVRAMETFLSGAPSALMNMGRRLNVG